MGISLRLRELELCSALPVVHKCQELLGMCAPSYFVCAHMDAAVDPRAQRQAAGLVQPIWVCWGPRGPLKHT